jgi:hypothetical protein
MGLCNLWLVEISVCSKNYPSRDKMFIEKGSTLHKTNETPTSQSCKCFVLMVGPVGHDPTTS